MYLLPPSKSFFVGFMIMLMIVLMISLAYAEIDLDIIAKIESNYNVKAYNKRSGARGLYQITPVCLLEYNRYNKEDVTLNDLFSPEVNKKIAKWYLEKRIPQMLKYYNIKITWDNVLWCYNSGIGNLRKDIMPNETLLYTERYLQLKMRKEML